VPLAFKDQQDLKDPPELRVALARQATPVLRVIPVPPVIQVPRVIPAPLD